MKLRSLSLFICAILTFGSMAQNKELPVILNYENTSGEKGISIFEYDGLQRMIKGRWQLLDTSRWSTNYYRYNTDGQLIEKYRIFSDDMTSSLKYEYDNSGKKSAEIFQRSDGIFGKSTFEYDEQGLPVRIICNKYYGWFDGEIIYTNYSNNKPLTAAIKRDGKELGTIEFTYTETGLIKTEIWITPRWSQTFSWEYAVLPSTYTSSNVFILENSRYRPGNENYSFNGENGGPSHFYYSGNGMLDKKIFARSDGVETHTRFFYDESGILKKSIRNYNNGDSLIFTYEYNSDRKLKKREGVHSNGEKSIEKYYYDKDQLVKAEWTNFDFWLTGNLKFEHANTGLIAAGTFTGQDFNADLIFKYDESGNLSAIRWNFSFGKYQEYTFDYDEQPPYIRR